MAALGALGTLALLVIVGERGALRVVWSRFGVAESIAGFRRARDDELGAEARARAPEFLRYPLRTVHEFEADGRTYVAAVETHTNPTADNPEPHPHRGVSLWVEV